LLSEPLFLTKPIFKQESAPFLKSLLQKAIRRGCIDQAVFACDQLLKMDFMLLYRRLPIIMVEDVNIHNSFAPLIWYMMANIPPCKLTYRWLLNLIVYMCRCKSALLYKKNDVRLPTNIKSLDPVVWGLIIRAQYGGMTGDIQMINNIILDLLDNNIIVLRDVLECTEVIPKIPENIMYDAIDFHVVPSILRNLPIPYEEAKQLMWFNASCLNFRKENSRKDFSTWTSICTEIRQRQSKYYQKLLNHN
jgi:hypothetical protein